MCFDFVLFLNDCFDWNLLCIYLVIMQECSVSCVVVCLYVMQLVVSQVLWWFEEMFECWLIEWCGVYFVLMLVGEVVYWIVSDIYGGILCFEIEIDDSMVDLIGLIWLLIVSCIELFVYDEFFVDFYCVYLCIDLQIEVMCLLDILLLLLQKMVMVGFGLCCMLYDKLEMCCFLCQCYVIYCGCYYWLFGQMQLWMDDLFVENFVLFMSDQIGDSLLLFIVFCDQKGFMGCIVVLLLSLEEVWWLIFVGYGIGCLFEYIVCDDIVQ